VVALAILAVVSLAGWISVLLGTARAWDLRPIAEDEPGPPDPAVWPSVAVLVPARNEASVLPSTLPALLAQDYPGEWRLVVVDDRSGDGTADAARACGVEPLAGAELPAGWVGKVWALEQAAARAGEPDYYLLTDADIRHAPHSLRRLVAESEAGRLALNSRMARLRCRSRAERLLIPPFLLFFNLLYPMRRVNDPSSRVAAAAGGCVLLRRDALERAGGFAAVRDRVIDDVSLARAVKQLGEPIRLAVSRSDVESLREHDLRGVWRMVRRTAFTELRHSWALLTATLALLVLLFPLPPLLAATSIGLVATTGTGAATLVALVTSALAWAAMTAAYLPTVRYFGLAPAWSLTLPLGGCLYGAMTLDSALRSSGGRRTAWS
jgi:hopene-associated glycosyltransferase HpnB